MTVALLQAGSATTFDALVADLAAPAFPSRDDVDSMAAILRRHIGAQPRPVGHAWHLQLSPGTVSLRVQTRRAMDEGDGTTTDELEREVNSASADDALVPDLVLFELEPTPRRAITEFSRGSRRRMTRTIAELDYAGWCRDEGSLAMVTLTLPALWEWIAPTGAHFKSLVETFRKRWIRAIGPWRGLWKLEFQRRGAPHMHMLLRVPALVAGERFEHWLSRTWADICAASLTDPIDREVYHAIGEYDRHLSAGTGVDFSGVKFSDPRRTSIYFLKHSSKTMDDKEYQHIVPELWQADGAGPGRFWGYWGLSRAVAGLELTRPDFVRARRILRAVARSRDAVTTMNRIRSSGEGSIWTMRRPRPRAGFGAQGGGWVLVNDGLALAFDLGRALAAP